MSKPLTKRCTYSSEFQDTQYGEKIRLHNPMKEIGKARCSVCGSESNIGSAKAEDKTVSKPTKTTTQKK